MRDAQPNSELRYARILVLLLVAFAFALAPAHADDYSHARIARLSLAEGAVEVQRPGAQSWEEAVANLPLQQGYRLATGGGRAEIEFENGATAYLSGDSALDFTELALDNGGRITRLTLAQGAGRFYANPARLDTFAVLTPDLTVFLDQRSDFRVDAYADGTSVTVFQGYVAVASSGSRWRLEKGQTFWLPSGGASDAGLVQTPDEDSFDHWVEQRSSVISAGSSDVAHYLTQANSPYLYGYGLADLSHYGSWIFYPGYGWGWQPRVAATGWVPFQDGTWLYSPGLGLCWVSQEPWGWMPYHFGRWAFTPLGWVWIPGHFNQWRPGVATWVRRGSQFGWVAQAPQDRPNLAPANLAQGVVVNPAAGAAIRGNAPGTAARVTSKIEPAKGFRVVPRPPPNLARRVASPLEPAGVPVFSPATASLPEAVRHGRLRRSGSGAIVYDPATRTYINGNRPVTPSASGFATSRAPIERSASPHGGEIPGFHAGRNGERGNHLPASGFGHGNKPRPQTPLSALPRPPQATPGARWQMDRSRSAEPKAPAAAAEPPRAAPGSRWQTNPRPHTTPPHSARPSRPAGTSVWRAAPRPGSHPEHPAHPSR